MNKFILIIGGVFIAILIVIFCYVFFFFKTPDPTYISSISPFYNFKYDKVIYPDQNLTPGEVATDDLKLICYEYYSRLLVKVPDETVKQVYDNYIITNPKKKEFEIDHWIPLALGGSNNIRNLWPQPVISPGYKERDYVHMYLREQVCNGKMSLTEAREQITGDWYNLYLNLKNQDND